MNSDEIRQRLGAIVSDATQAGILATLKNEGDNGEGSPAALNLGCNTALCALIPVVSFVIKKPDMTKEEAKKNPNKLLEYLNFETVLFTALIAARMHGGLHATDAENIGDDALGLNVSGEVNFGPHTIGEALNDWKKVTGKNPADYFSAELLKAIEESERETLAPFDEFLKNCQSAPSSKTLQ